MSNTNTNLQTQTSSVLNNDTVFSCSTSKVQEKTQLSRIEIMTDSTVQDDSSRSGNDTDADDADIRPIYDEEPMAKVLLEKNVYKGKIATKIELTLEDKHNKVFSNDVTGLDDGVAASFQEVKFHKHMPHTQCFKVNRSNIKKLILSPPLSKSLKGKLKAQVDQESQIKMIQVKEMMQDNDLKNLKSKDKGSRSRSQSMNEQSPTNKTRNQNKAKHKRQKVRISSTHRIRRSMKKETQHVGDLVNLKICR
ncbi:hypothetical protein Tco_0647914 [Tanacetum coccineum]